MIGSRKLIHNPKKAARVDHCKVCTQCDYWHKQIKIYERKIVHHMEQVKNAALNTAQFNSLQGITMKQSN